MKHIDLPWGSWYGDGRKLLDIPKSWTINYLTMEDAKDLNDDEIDKALSRPVDSTRLEDLARGKSSAAILVDDLTRPTKTYRLLPPIIDRLKSGGIEEMDILILVALGAHRPLARTDLIKKLGKRVVRNFRIVNHHPHENTIYLGESERGTPIHINKYFYRADLKIGVSSITPHGWAGFGGGGKIVLPGCSGIETIEVNHRPVVRKKSAGINEVEKNENRADIEDVARKAGLDFTVNVVPNSSRGIAGVFAGDLVSAHRAGVKVARKVFATKVVPKADIGIFNAYPKDTEFIQSSHSLNVYRSAKPEELVRNGGVVVITTAASEGVGFNSLTMDGMRLHREEGSLKRDGIVDSRALIVFSENVNSYDIHPYLPKTVCFCSKWEEVLAKTESILKQDCYQVSVYPTAPLQLGKAERVGNKQLKESEECL